MLVAAATGMEACLRGIARYGRPRGWHIMSDMAHTGVFPQGWEGDGIIAVANHQENFISEILAADAPCVEIAFSGEGMICPSIRGDNIAVGELAADHLMRRAFRSYAWAPFIADSTNEALLAGFEARLADQDLRCQMLPAAHGFSGGRRIGDRAAYRRELFTRLQQLPRPAAIFAANDCVALEIAAACRELELVLPDEIAVLGVGNDVALCESFPIPLSSVVLDREEMAFRAAAALEGIMRGHSVPDLILVPPGQVVARASTMDASAIPGSSSHGLIRS